jgi:hypothetical protein
MTRQPGHILLKFLAVFVGGCILVWCVTTVGLYAAMLQPPERFGAVMARVPTIAMRLLPFRRLWMSARAGNLQIGDQAPDFELPMLHGKGRVKLSDASRARPVVLIFGSYT